MPKPYGLTGWIDQDRSHLRTQPLPVWIDWFEYRVRLVVINPLAHILDTQITADPDSSALLIYGVSICCAIEAMGKFIVGNVNHDLRFEAFVQRMSHELRAGIHGGEANSALLRKYLRNGLTHGFAVCRGGFSGNRGNPYFGVDAAGDLLVNPAALFDDFVQAFDSYVAGLRSGSADLAMFESVFKEVFIDGK